jgi:hypothetical protein
MPAELLNLNEQLLNLKIVYEDAVFNDKPLAVIQKISAQIKVVEKLIAERKEYMKKQQSPN